MTLAAARSKLAAGSVWYLTGSVAVHAGNYVFNVAIARLLTPAEYADVALAVTALLLLGFFTVGLQLATARIVAMGGDDPDGTESLVRWFGRVGVRTGVLLASAMLVALPLLTRALNTASAAPIVATAVAVPFAFAAAVGRGRLQGSSRFARLALSFQAEMATRLLLGVGAVVLGLGVAGAVGALTVSVIVAAAIGLPPTGSVAPLDAGRRRLLLAALGPMLLLLAGEALVNHVDTVVAKSAFDPATAGLYAGVALLGRTVFFVTWPVTMLVFPSVASAAAAGRSVAGLVRTATGVVGALGAVAVVCGSIYPERIVRLALGDDFVGAAGLLGPYLAATALFAVAATVLSLRVAAGDDRAVVVALTAGVAVVVGLGVFHPTPEAVVWFQVAMMGVLAMTVVGGAVRRGWTVR